MHGRLCNVFHPSNFLLMSAWAYYLIVAYVTVWWTRNHSKGGTLKAPDHHTTECSCEIMANSCSKGATGVVMGEHEVVQHCERCNGKGTGKDWPDAGVQAGLLGTAIVTGASSGLGQATAVALARQNFHVIIACHSLKKGQKAAMKIRQQYGKVSLDVLELDLCSLHSIRAFSSRVRQTMASSKNPRSLRLLVNNAGILAASRRWTKDGLERMITTNYLGAFALTSQLLPLLQEAPQARVVNVSSFTHHAVWSIDVAPTSLAAGGLGEGSVTGAGRYRMAEIYQMSKLCMVLFTYELQRRLLRGSDTCHVSCIAVDPGMFDSAIMRELPCWLSWTLARFFKLFGLMQSSSQAAEAVVSAATAPADVRGVYVAGSDGVPISSSLLSYDRSLASELWKASASLTSTRVATNN